MLKFVRLTLLVAVTLVALLAQSAEAKQINLRWTKKTVKANVPRGGKRMLDAKKKIMKVRGGFVEAVVLHFFLWREFGLLRPIDV